MSDVNDWAGTVRIYGGAGVEGEEHRHARLIRLGDDYKLMVPEPGRRPKTLDRVVNGKVTDDGEGRVTVVGTSEYLVNTVGVPEESAHVRWELTLRGCQSCG